jgi:chemotaxis protein MotA
MIAILGFIVVFGATLGGFLAHGGVLQVLFQPSEFLIIGGAAIGSILVGTPHSVQKEIVRRIIGTLTGNSINKAAYLELLHILFDVFQVGRKGGLMSLESHVETPDKSEIFKKYPTFLRNHHAVYFLADSLKVMISAGLPPIEMEALMESDLDTHHQEAMLPANALFKVADALPGLGIVAAVLGIVITMGAIDGPAAEIGKKVAAALVGTFLGVLLSYGLVQPLATNIESCVNREACYYRCMKAALVAFAKGASPLIAVEFARRTIFASDRPTWNEMEAAVKNRKKSEQPQAVAA